MPRSCRGTRRGRVTYLRGLRHIPRFVLGDIVTKRCSVQPENRQTHYVTIHLRPTHDFSNDCGAAHLYLRHIMHHATN